MKLILANIKIDTEHDEAFLNLSIEEKLNYLENAVKSLNDKLADETNTQTVKGMLIAPEYFFSKINQKGKVGQYNVHESKTIQKGLSSLSKKYPGILIIPGTVAWQKEAVASPSHEGTTLGSACLNQDEYIKDKEARGIFRKRNRMAYLKYATKPGSSNLNAAKCFLIQPMRQNHADAGRTVPANNPYAKFLQLNNNELDELLLSRNTAYFYLNGQQVYKYHQRSDYQEVLDANNNAYIPGIGLRSPVYTTPDGVSIGIEICLDHNCASLSKAINHDLLLLIKHNQGVKIHLILSTYVQEKDENIRHSDNGYLVHSSSRGFWVKNKERLTASNETSNKLSLHELNL